MRSDPDVWRHVGGTFAAWFEASSLPESAELARNVLELTDEAAIEARARGVRIALPSDELCEAVAARAGEMGLRPDPGPLQRVVVVIESTDPAPISAFWRPVLGYEADGSTLVDPLRRDPAVRLVPTDAHRPLRNRVHLDVVRPGPVVEQVRPGKPFGAFGVCHADPDGNEVDLVPGDPLEGGDATAHWQSVFSAVACYRTTSPSQQAALVSTAAALADEDGFPLAIDLRRDLVVLDSGKDRWHPDAHGLDVDFGSLAAEIQATARDLGASADAALPRFVQIFLDAADIDAVRRFWTTTLGYVEDHRQELTDIHDPHWLNPVLLFQPLDPSEADRREQRNRLHIELAVPADRAADRVATALSAGGRLIEESANRWLIADPEGNELHLVTD